MKHPELPEEFKAEIKAEIKAGAELVRNKWRWLRRTGWFSGGTLLFLVVVLVGLFFWASSAAFEDIVRRRMVTALEDATGGRVEIAAFHWRLLDLSAEASGITVHGLEGAGEAPYAHVERLRVRVALLGMLPLGLSPRVLLREAEIVQPEFHLIVYPDGTTNQPHPRRVQRPGRPVMDTLFDAEIGQLTVERGTVQIANQLIPLDLRAKDTDLHLSWVPDPRGALAKAMTASNAGSYRIGLSLGELSFAQKKYDPVQSRLDASVLLMRDAVQVDSLRLVAMGQTLDLKGRLTGFAHPVWTAQAGGAVDLRVLGPTIGFASCRSGVVHLRAAADGRGEEFKTSGELSADAIHYQDSVVDAQTATFAAKFKADPKLLVVSDVRTKLSQGGEVDGEFRFENWLANTPAKAVQKEMRAAHKSWPVPAGTVKGNVNGVTLDTVLAILAAPGYRRLGLDTVVNGPAEASWTGLAEDLEIGGKFALAPSGVAITGEAPLQGSVDGTFHADSGSVQVRTLAAKLPHSSITGTGLLGVIPVTRASTMNLDLESTDLSEFDGALRALGLKQGNLMGAAALPVKLHGEAQFHGQLNSSWITPRVDGHVMATNVEIEMLPAGGAAADAPLNFMHWDSVDMDAQYSPQSIVVRHGVLRRGGASLTLQGQLDADDPAYTLADTETEFDGDSALHLKATAVDFPLSDLLPLAGVTAPVTGKLNAQVDVQGPVKALSGSGTVDVERLAGYGESVEHVHAAGTADGKLLRISSFSAVQAAGAHAGRLTGTGSYDLAHRTFQLNALGTAIDLESIQRVKATGIPVTGKLGFTAAGEGSLDDPRVQVKATFSGMAIGGEPVSDLLISAASRQRAVTYDLSSHQLAGQFTAHGVTNLNADYTTQARLDFTKFDVGALLKLLKVTGINGQSDLEGSASVSGPLAHPEKLGGEANLKELAVAVQGVHLASKGPVHATLANGVAKLDPVEITGEDTDLKLRGTLAVAGKQQLDLQADGSVNMRLAESLDADLIASGSTKFQMEAHGPLAAPILSGKVEFQNASLALQDFPNGLSQIKGTLEFIQNRLEVRSLTAMSGGGQLSVGGYIGFQKGLYADLNATGKAIRIRYPQGISSLADASLRLQGPQNNLLLSGNVQVTRFAINADLDMTAFAATASVQPIIAPDAPSNHIRFDVHLTSAPQLNFQNAYAKLAGDVDLHLRGTLASPSLLGRISLTEGSASIGGTKYELERGDIYFNNPVRIQPNIDVDATARVEDYDITLGLHGTPEHPNVTYRSEPPLPEADVIALLALGRTQGEQTALSQQQQQAGDNPSTDALLGGALNATVSNRVQRLFGTGAIKVDPNFIGSLGNSTARVTVVEQIGKNLTFTYASNVNTTTQQLIQAEIAINRHVSLLVTQDEAGIFSIVVKTRRRYK